MGGEEGFLLRSAAFQTFKQINRGRRKAMAYTHTGSVWVHVCVRACVCVCTYTGIMSCVASARGGTKKHLGKVRNIFTDVKFPH